MSLPGHHRHLGYLRNRKTQIQRPRLRTRLRHLPTRRLALHMPHTHIPRPLTNRCRKTNRRLVFHSRLQTQHHLARITSPTNKCRMGPRLSSHALSNPLNPICRTPRHSRTARNPRSLTSHSSSRHHPPLQIKTTHRNFNRT